MGLENLLDSLAGLGAFGSSSRASNTTSLSTAVNTNATIANIFGSGSVSPDNKATQSPSAPIYAPPGSLDSYDLASQFPFLNSTGQLGGPQLNPNILGATVGGIPIWVIGLGGIAALLLIGGIAKRF